MNLKTALRTGKELILATKPYAVEYPARSWWYFLSTAFLLMASVAGTLWNFWVAGKIVTVDPQIAQQIRALTKQCEQRQMIGA